MSYDAPYAVERRPTPPWGRPEGPFGRILTDVGVDGASYMDGHLAYNGALDTPKRLRRLDYFERRNAGVQAPRRGGTAAPGPERQGPRGEAGAPGATRSRTIPAIGQRSTPAPAAARGQAATGARAHHRRSRARRRAPATARRRPARSCRRSGRSGGRARRLAVGGVGRRGAPAAASCAARRGPRARARGAGVGRFSAGQARDFQEG
ncbi:unnamed protein product, partial [Prorocentrum cordatum]